MPHIRRYAKPRRGVILLVVVTMLTLFAAVGLAFVLSAESEAKSSRIFREAQDTRFFDGPDPEQIFNRAIGDLIYDVPDDSGYNNAIRGHSLARSVYGWNYDYLGSGASPPVLYGPTRGLNNTIPYNGFGAMQADLNNDNTPETTILNYSYVPGDPIVIDPERLGNRPAPGGAGAPGTPGTYVGKNLGHTYPDINNAYLAAMSADGNVLVPSFHRPEIAGPLDATNPNWNNAIGRRLFLRPRPVDHTLNGTTEFPMPSDAGGDVKNLFGAPGGNDSVWVDFDLPVRTWKGKLYKPLIAMLVLDLDNRINVNALGNLAGPAPMGEVGTHASHQGWGVWESDMRYAFTRDASQAVNDARRILAGDLLTTTGTPTTIGRFGRDRLAQSFDNLNIATAGDNPRFYGQVDYDGSTLTSLEPDPMFLRLALPGQTLGTTQASGYVPFPRFPLRYQNGTGTERNNHASLFNPFYAPDRVPTGPTADRSFDLNELVYLNREWQYPNDLSTNSELRLLSPTNLAATVPPGQINPRWLVTPLSNDLDRPALPVGVIDTATSGYQIPIDATTFAPTAPYPTTGVNTPAVPSNGVTIMGSSDLDTFSQPGRTCWRNVRAAIGGVNLNRRLADYRIDATQPYGKRADGTFNINATTFNAATQDRQLFAREIFDRLVIATGANPNATAGATPDASPEHNALRWLAQLAVNIVDYVDPDEYITPFMWGAETVYGFEVPKLVINEAYAQVNNDPTDPFTGMRATLPFHVNFWVELHNPHSVDPANPTNSDQTDAVLSDANGSFAGSARLFDAAIGAPMYKVIIADAAQVSSNTLAAVNNPAGNIPAAAIKCETRTMATAGGFTPTLDAANQWVVRPANGAYNTVAQGNRGFYVLGPSENMYQNAIGDSSMRLQYNAPPGPGQAADGLKYEEPLTTTPAMIAGRDHTIVLQRLACPHIAPGPNNPYITVDVMDGIRPNDGVQNDNGGMHTNTPVDMRVSRGRTEPFAGRAGELRDQNPTTPNAGQCKHTFFRHNGVSSTATNADELGSGGTLRWPFHWPTHLDRQLINPIELLQVTATPPALFTQRFTPTDMTAHTVQAAFLDQNTRLYRSLELLRCASRAKGMGEGGKLPGKINVNTVWTPEAWNSVFSPNDDGSHNFTSADVTNAFNAFSTTRTLPNAPAPGTGRGYFTGFGNPVKGNGATTDGIAGTFLRPQTSGGLAPNPGTHPYEQFEMLRKGYNSMTTRSNCFAVWCTIGYFEVRGYTPGTNSRPILGKEMFDDTPGDLRNKFFAVIDRTNLSIDPNPIDPDSAFQNQRKQGPTPFYSTLIQTVQPGGQGTITVPVASISGTVLNVQFEGRTVPVEAGVTRLLVDYSRNPSTLGTDPTTDANSRMEMVTVQNVTATGNVGTITFTCAKAHAAGTMVTNVLLGNPGPQATFNYRAAPYDAVVPLTQRLR